MKEGQKTPSRDSDKFMIRFPDGMRDVIKQQAVENNRTMNSEIINMLRKVMEGKDGAAQAA